MSIEYQETRFGHPVGEPKPAEPGTKDWLWLRPLHGTYVGESIRVDGPYRITHTFVSSLGVVIPTVYTREQINEQKFQTSPVVKFSDLFLWRRRHYSWREDK